MVRIWWGTWPKRLIPFVLKWRLHIALFDDVPGQKCVVSWLLWVTFFFVARDLVIPYSSYEINAAVYSSQPCRYHPKDELHTVGVYNGYLLCYLCVLQCDQWHSPWFIGVDCDLSFGNPSRSYARQSRDTENTRKLAFGNLQVVEAGNTRKWAFGNFQIIESALI